MSEPVRKLAEAYVRDLVMRKVKVAILKAFPEGLRNHADVQHRLKLVVADAMATELRGLGYRDEDVARVKFDLTLDVKKGTLEFRAWDDDGSTAAPRVDGGG